MGGNITSVVEMCSIAPFVELSLLVPKRFLLYLIFWLVLEENPFT